jgi:hypothetical protein
MTLKVIGSGLGRTGTMSMKRALEALGFGPCHHMVEVFQHPESVPLWNAASDGKPQWDVIFKDYRAAVDYPSCKYWRELARHYPDAKVLHTVRDPDTWFDSTQATIFAPTAFAANPPEHLKAFFQSIVGDFGDRIHDRAFMTAYFREHSAEVERTIPKERLLVYHVGEGWDRLCRFLDVPIPTTPYPSENTRAEFMARAAARAAEAKEGAPVK